MQPTIRYPAGESGLTLHLVGLGDVGGTLLTGLLLTCPMLKTIGIYDPDANRVSRYEQEMNQILPVDGTKPQVVPLAYEELFDGCDVFVFTASAGVPPLGAEQTDVRMVQFEKNRSIVRPYARMALEKQYDGLFVQVSDPVDLLCGVVCETGLQPQQIVGCGLGVMRARADYCARRHGVKDFLSRGRVFGPHGGGLIVANDPGPGYDDALSRALTDEVLTANLAVRATGSKPYIAPGLSSGALTIRSMLRGEFFDASFGQQGIFWGCRARMTPQGFVQESLSLHPQLAARVQQSKEEMMQAWKRV